jgi:hypothetical protein
LALHVEGIAENTPGEHSHHAGIAWPRAANVHNRHKLLRKFESDGRYSW